MRWRTDTQHDPSLLRTRGVYITPYILSNKLFSFAGLFQHHLHPVTANRTQREVKQHGHHSRYYCTYYCISDAKKKKAENNKKYKLQQQYLLESDSSLQQGATLTTSEPHTLTPLNLTHPHPCTRQTFMPCVCQQLCNVSCVSTVYCLVLLCTAV